MEFGHVDKSIRRSSVGHTHGVSFLDRPVFTLLRWAVVEILDFQAATVALLDADDKIGVGMEQYAEGNLEKDQARRLFCL